MRLKIVNRMAPRLLLITGLLALSGAAAAEKFTFTYAVSRAGQEIGETRETFEQANGRYRIESTATPKGLAAVFISDTFRMLSEGDYSKDGLRPTHYEYHRSTRPNKSILTDFDWTAKTLTARFEGKSETHPLPDGAQDRLSALYQLQFWPKDQTEQALAISTGKNVKTHTYKRVGEETISTPAGSFRTLHFARERTADDDGIQIWVSDKLPAPIKVIVEEKKGAQNEQVLTGFQRE